MAEGFESGTSSDFRGQSDKRQKLSHRSHHDCPPNRHERDAAGVTLRPTYGSPERSTPSPPLETRRQLQKDDYDGAESQACVSLRDLLHADGGLYLERLHEMIERQKEEWFRSRDQSTVADFSPRPNADPVGGLEKRQFSREIQKDTTPSRHSAANHTEPSAMTEPDSPGAGRSLPGTPGRFDHTECGSLQRSDHRDPNSQGAHRQQTEPLIPETGKATSSKTLEQVNPKLRGAQQPQSHILQNVTPRCPMTTGSAGHRDPEQAGKSGQEHPSFEEQLGSEFEILRAVAKSLKGSARSSPSMTASCFEKCVISEMRSIRSQCLAYCQTVDQPSRQQQLQQQQQQRSFPAAAAQQEQRAGGAQLTGPNTPFEREVLALVRNLRQAHERFLSLTVGRGQGGGNPAGGHPDASVPYLMSPTSFEDMVLGKLRELGGQIGFQATETSVNWPKTNAGHEANRASPSPHHHHHHHHRPPSGHRHDGAEIVTSRGTQTGDVGFDIGYSQRDKAVNTGFDLPPSPTAAHGKMSPPPPSLDMGTDLSVRNDQIRDLRPVDARRKQHESLVQGKKCFDDDLRRDDCCEDDDDDDVRCTTLSRRQEESGYRAAVKSGFYKNADQTRPCPNVSFREPLTDMDCAKILASECGESSDECGDVIEEVDVDCCDLTRPPDRLSVFQDQYDRTSDLNANPFNRFQYQLPNAQTPAPLELSQYVSQVPQQMAFNPTQNQIPRIQSTNITSLPILEIPQNSFGVIQCQTPIIQSAVPNLSQYPISETPITPYSFIIQGQTPGIQPLAPNLSQYPIPETPLTSFNVIQGQTPGFQPAAPNLSQYPITETPMTSFNGIQCQTPGIQHTVPNLSQYPISDSPLTSFNGTQCRAPGIQPAVSDLPQFQISESALTSIPTKRNNALSFAADSSYPNRFQSNSLDCDRYKSRPGTDPIARQPLTSSVRPGEVQPVHLSSATEHGGQLRAGHFHGGGATSISTQLDCERFHAKEPLRSSNPVGLHLTSAADRTDALSNSRRFYDDCIESPHYDALDHNAGEKERSHRWTKVALDDCDQEDSLWWDCGPKDEPPFRSSYRSLPTDCDGMSVLDGATAGSSCREQRSRRPPSYNNCDSMETTGRASYPNARNSTQLFKQLNAWCRRGHGPAAKGPADGRRLRRQHSPSPSSCITSTANYRRKATKRPLSKGKERKLDCREILASADNLCPRYDPCADSPSDSDC